MRTRFYIEKRKSTEGNLMLVERPVLMKVSFQGQHLMLGTGIQSSLSDWDEEKQRLRDGASIAPEVNRWLDTLEQTALHTWAIMLMNEDETDEQTFRNLFHQLKPGKSSGFFDVYLRFMEEVAKSWSRANFQKVRALYKHLRALELERDSVLTLGDMGAPFREEFKGFLLEKGMRNSAVYKSVNTLDWFLNWATEKGYSANLQHRSFYKSLGNGNLSSESTCFLQWQELMDLFECTCASRKEERTRDLFCLMCFTGMNFREIQELKKKDVSEKEVIVRKRGARQRHIPLNDIAASIVRKYENRFYLENAAFPSMSVVSFHKHIGMIAREAGLDRMVFPDDHTGERKALYEIISTGTAIRTFITNALSLETAPGLLPDYTGTGHDDLVKRILREMADQEINKIA